MRREIKQVWDPIQIRWPIPICYYPPIWELVLFRDKLDEPLVKELVVEDPMPTAETMTKYYRKRIELTKSLIDEKMLDAGIGNRAIAHFQNHLKELGIEK